MPVAKPTHPGRVLRDRVLRDRVLPGLGLSVIQAAREPHICRQTPHRSLAGRAAITPDMAARLARLTGMPGRFRLNLQQDDDLARG